MIIQISPHEAWQMLQDNDQAILLDVRDPLEFQLVGHPVGAINIPWKFAPSWQVNSLFVQQVEQQFPSPRGPMLLLCRSGQRSQDAALTLEAAGFNQLYNVLEGFEGPLDTEKHRSSIGGWRHLGLPWIQS
ncbi:MAG: hypothetical protein RIQ52_802 [Pseudomonadota bacterium]|jgi:rhodanese-related sulfurtransferase